MAKYNASSIAGESWVRCFRVEINNPLPTANAAARPMQDGLVSPDVPHIFFVEEKVCQMSDGSVVKQPVNNDNAFSFAKEQMSLETLGTEFPILDADGKPTGATATFEEVYDLLASLYIFSAKRRDEMLAKMEADQARRLAEMKAKASASGASGPV